MNAVKGRGTITHRSIRPITEHAPVLGWKSHQLEKMVEVRQEAASTGG